MFAHQTERSFFYSILKQLSPTCSEGARYGEPYECNILVSMRVGHLRVAASCLCLFVRVYEGGPPRGGRHLTRGMLNEATTLAEDYPLKLAHSLGLPPFALVHSLRR